MVKRQNTQQVSSAQREPELLSETTSASSVEQEIAQLKAELECQKQLNQLKTLELEASQGELFKAVNELQESQKQLIDAEKMASLGQLVAGIAHEINTPLGICVTAASFMAHQVNTLRTRANDGTLTKSLLKSSSDSVSESTDLILANLNRANSLISSFKQVAVEQCSESRHQFNLAQNLDQIITSLSHVLKRDRVTVDIDCDQNLEIDSFPGSFMQIYTNLMVNSLKHGFENWSGEKRIEISVKKVEQTLRIDYKDTGKGIDPSIIERLFEPFVTTKRGQGGSGLGTNIIHNLVVQLLQGSIECHSTPDHGVHFIISIPFER